jgi:hypothetical protein
MSCVRSSVENSPTGRTCRLRRWCGRALVPQHAHGGARSTVPVADCVAGMPRSWRRTPFGRPTLPSGDRTAGAGYVGYAGYRSSHGIEAGPARSGLPTWTITYGADPGAGQQSDATAPRLECWSLSISTCCAARSPSSTTNEPTVEDASPDPATDAKLRMIPSEI